MATKKVAAKKSSKAVINKAVKGNKFASSVRDSAQDIWLAGLGAFAKAQDEGSRMFDVLVSEGKSIQDRVRGVAGTVKGKFSDKRVADVTDKLVGSWGKLGQMVEDRAADALSRAGVATKKEVDTLSRRVSKLGVEVEKLATAKKTVVKSVARAVVKPAAKAVAKATTVKSVPTTTGSKVSPKAIPKAASKAARKAANKSPAKPAAKPVAVTKPAAMAAVEVKPEVIAAVTPVAVPTGV